MVRWPLCLLDMDVPVDGADAFVITTAERARDLRLPPVLINAAVLGMIDQNVEDLSGGVHLRQLWPNAGRPAQIVPECQARFFAP